MIGVVTGMLSEARLVPGRSVLCSGGRPRRARQLAERLLAEGADGLLSFGVAGGLVPELRPGCLLVGSGVVIGAARLAADARWCRRLAEALPRARLGMIYGGDVVAADATAKRALHQQWGALAVDLESRAVAEACVAAGKPFAVLRAIADPAERGIPALAMAGLAADGATRPWAVTRGLLRRPQDLPGLIRLGLETRAALRALGVGVGILGLGLGFDLP